jgi:predicted GTPase
VVAIWGIPCVGKSYLAKRVYYQQQVKKGLAEYYGCVTVSHPFNLRDLSWRLLTDFHSESLTRRSIMGIKDPIEECRELIQGHVCLIVIDGLQSMDEWDSIKNALALRQTRSRIIVITNEERVAAYCATSRDAVLNIEGLKVHEALDLFKKKVC